MSSPID
jgi:hypothetical protein